MNGDHIFSVAIVRLGGRPQSDLFEWNSQLRVEKIGTELLGDTKLAGMILCHVDDGMVVIGRRLESLHGHGNRAESAVEQVIGIVDYRGGDARHYRRSIQETQTLFCFELQKWNSFCFQSLRSRDTLAAVKHSSTPEHCPSDVCHWTKIAAGPYRSV